jgi:hypothetical protein
MCLGESTNRIGTKGMFCQHGHEVSSSFLCKSLTLQVARGSTSHHYLVLSQCTHWVAIDCYAPNTKKEMSKQLKVLKLVIKFIWLIHINSSNKFIILNTFYCSVCTCTCAHTHMVPHTLASMDQNPVCRPRTLSPFATRVPRVTFWRGASSLTSAQFLSLPVWTLQASCACYWLWSQCSFVTQSASNVNSCSIFEPKRSEMKSRMDDVTKRGVWLVLLAQTSAVFNHVLLLTDKLLQSSWKLKISKG